MISGSYPGEIFTNGIWYNDAQDPNVMHYGFGYSPDSGRHFIVTLDITDQFIQNRMHGIGHLGEFYLHDPNDAILLRFNNFGASFTFGAYCEEIDLIEPGAGRFQLFLLDNAAEGSQLYHSENGGNTYAPVSYFPQMTISTMAYERESGILYLLGQDNLESQVYLYKSGDNGQIFNAFGMDAQVPEAGLLGFKLLPTPDGTIYLLQGRLLNNGNREFRLYQSGDNLQSCALVWQYTPFIYEYGIDMIWTGVEGSELLRQSFYWHMAYSRLEYFVSSISEIDFQSVALYNFYYPYQNPVFLVPTASGSELGSGAGSVKLYVRSNNDWQISSDEGWVSGFSQISGEGSADIFMHYEANSSGMDRSCVVHFHSTAAPDTFLVLTQSGNVSIEDICSASSELIYYYPNPFSNSVNINGKLPQAEAIELKIYNIRGELVRVLHSQSDQRGEYYLNWDATDGLGRRVSSGVYLCRMQAGRYRCTHKLLYW